MNDTKDAPLVVDADYHVVEGDRGIPSKDIRFGDVIITEKHKKTFRDIVKIVVKSVFYFLLWSVRQLGSLMIEGFSGVVSGIKDAADKESEYDTKNNYRRRTGASGVRKRDRPIWDIPTREEEEAGNNMRYRYGR